MESKTYHLFTSSSACGNFFETVAISEDEIEDAKISDGFNPLDYIVPNCHGGELTKHGEFTIEGPDLGIFDGYFTTSGFKG